jgi:DNA-binding transcriptional LysR family regulator
MERVRKLGQRERTKLRIAYTEIASGDAMLTAFVQRLRESMPAAELNMLPMPSSQQIEALLKGRIEVGCLCCFPEMDDRIKVQPLMEHSMVAIMQRGHRLARRHKICLRDLLDQRLIFVSRDVRPDLHRLVTEAFRRSGLALPDIEEVSSSARITSLVSVGMGVGLVMSSTKPQLPESITARPIADLSIRYRLALAWCSTSKNANVAKLAALARESPYFPAPAA